MKIALGSDHRGIMAANALMGHLRPEGHEVEVLGETSGKSCDYPDSAWQVCQAVSSGRADRGILLCGTGIGMCIAANKVPGIRAALAPDELSARLSRSHNDANVLCLSADLIGQTLVKRIVDLWLTTPFDGGRHQRRLGKIQLIERGVNPAEGAAGIDLAPGS
ncbi:MAG: ribose 5-phosphate isomerase B [Phycisphaerae bacterium]|nr:ribose 5-phosphate isomerase B [Phycisphaerae bacterium]